MAFTSAASTAPSEVPAALLLLDFSVSDAIAPNLLGAALGRLSPPGPRVKGGEGLTQGHGILARVRC